MIKISRGRHAAIKIQRTTSQTRNPNELSQGNRSAPTLCMGCLKKQTTDVEETLTESGYSATVAMAEGLARSRTMLTLTQLAGSFA